MFMIIGGVHVSTIVLSLKIHAYLLTLSLSLSNNKSSCLLIWLCYYKAYNKLHSNSKYCQEKYNNHIQSTSTAFMGGGSIGVLTPFKKMNIITPYLDYSKNIKSLDVLIYITSSRYLLTNKGRFSHNI